MLKKVSMNYGAFEAHGIKAFAQGVTLRPYEEVVGHLYQLDECDGVLLAEIGDIIVRLPLEMRPALSQLVGSRIGLLRTDIPSKEYLVRQLPDRGEIFRIKNENGPDVFEGVN